SSCAGRLAKAPLNEPTGVRAALTMTMSSFIRNSSWADRDRPFEPPGDYLALPHPRATRLPLSTTGNAWISPRIGPFRRDPQGWPHRPLGPPRRHKTTGPRKRKPAMLDLGAGENVIAMADEKEPIKIKKYANRRLYNTGTSAYVTLEDLATMVKGGEDFV